MCEDRYKGGFRCKPHIRKRLDALEHKINVAILNSIPDDVQLDFNSWVPTQLQGAHVRFLFDADEELTDAITKEALARARHSQHPNLKAVQLAEAKTSAASIAASEKAGWFVFMRSSKVLQDATFAFQNTDAGKKLYNQYAYLSVTGGILNDAAYNALDKRIYASYTSAVEAAELERERARQEKLRNAFATLNQIKSYQSCSLMPGISDCVIGIGSKAIYLVSRKKAQKVIDNHAAEMADTNLDGDEAKLVLLERSMYLERAPWTKKKLHDLVEECTDIINNEVTQFNVQRGLAHVNV